MWNQGEEVNVTDLNRTGPVHTHPCVSCQEPTQCDLTPEECNDFTHFCGKNECFQKWLESNRFPSSPIHDPICPECEGKCDDQDPDTGYFICSICGRKWKPSEVKGEVETIGVVGIKKEDPNGN